MDTSSRLTITVHEARSVQGQVLFPAPHAGVAQRAEATGQQTQANVPNSTLPHITISTGHHQGVRLRVRFSPALPRRAVAQLVERKHYGFRGALNRRW